MKSPQSMSRGFASGALAPFAELLLMLQAAAEMRSIISSACACLAASFACTGRLHISRCATIQIDIKAMQGSTLES